MTTFPGYFMLNRDVASKANVEAGTASKMVDAAQLRAAMPYTKYFESTQQTIVAAGAISIAHPFGVKPILTKYVLQCLSAEQGYSIGDEIVEDIRGWNATPTGLVLTPDASNIVGRYGNSAIVVHHKTTGVAVVLTNASWRAVFRIWG